RSADLRGTTVGLLTPGSNEGICDKLLFSTFNTTYFVSFARNTDRTRCKSSHKIGFSARPSRPIRIASERLTSAKGLRPLLLSVPPVETISQIGSRRLRPGAIGTEPEL